MEVRNLNLWYGEKQALFDVSMPIKRNSITALIGPSGCGKSTLLRTLNRMNDLVPGCRIEGEVEFDGKNIFAPDSNVLEMRKRVGMIFQKPNPFPMSIRDNITYGPKLHGITNRQELETIVEESLRKAALWDEVKDRLGSFGLALSGGQQQRLCIARAISVNPEVILMDEPTAMLDPSGRREVMETVERLHKEEGMTVVLITHFMDEALRGDRVAVMEKGRLVEAGDAAEVLCNPQAAYTKRLLKAVPRLDL